MSDWKKKWKRFWFSLQLAFTRPDICPRHWTKKERVSKGYSSLVHGDVVGLACPECDAEEASLVEAAKEKAADREVEFMKSLEALRKELL